MGNPHQCYTFCVTKWYFYSRHTPSSHLHYLRIKSRLRSQAPHPLKCDTTWQLTPALFDVDLFFKITVNDHKGSLNVKWLWIGSKIGSPPGLSTSSSRPLLVFEARAYSSQKQSYLPLHFCGPTKDLSLSLCPALFFTDQPGTCCVTSYTTSGKDSGMLKIELITAKLITNRS